MSNLKRIEEHLEKAPSIKSMLQMEVVQERFIANYQATTGKTDGQARFQSEAFAYMEIITEKPELAALPKFQHFAAIIKGGTTGLSFRDSKLYVMPGPNKTIKVQSSPAGKREMMENMDLIKQVPEAQIVMKGDIFVVDKLNGLVTKHESTEKSVTDIKLENIVASYQRVYWKDGTIKDVVVMHDDLMKARKRSPAQSEQSFWATYPGEAAKKVSTNRAFRLYHKYPDNLITFGKDDDKQEDEQETLETAHQEIKPDQPVTETPAAVQDEVPAQEAKVMPKSNMDDFLKS